MWSKQVPSGGRSEGAFSKLPQECQIYGKRTHLRGTVGQILHHFSRR